MLCGLLNIHHATNTPTTNTTNTTNTNPPTDSVANTHNTHNIPIPPPMPPVFLSLFKGLAVIPKPCGFNYALMYYSLPSVVFICLYSVLPHKVRKHNY